MQEDRYDRFTSEMTVYKSAEEAFAAADENKRKLEERLARRRAEREKTNAERK